MLDLSLETGKPPLRLLDGGYPDSWSELDLEIVSQWRHLKEAKCHGCGRPLSQHLYNSRLGREETPEDYIPHTIDCPALQAIAGGQEMWKDYNASEIKAYQKGSGADPGAGVFWIAQGHGEVLPAPVKP